MLKDKKQNHFLTTLVALSVCALPWLTNKGQSQTEETGARDSMIASENSQTKASTAQGARGAVWSTAAAACSIACAAASGADAGVCTAASITGEISQAVIEKELSKDLMGITTKLGSNAMGVKDAYGEMSKEIAKKKAKDAAKKGANDAGKKVTTEAGEKAAKDTGEKVATDGTKSGAKKAGEKVGCIIQAAVMGATAVTSFTSSNSFKASAKDLKTVRENNFDRFKNEPERMIEAGGGKNPYESGENGFQLSKAGGKQDINLNYQNNRSSLDLSSPCSNMSSNSDLYKCATEADPELKKAYPEKKFQADLNKLLGNQASQFARNLPSSLSDSFNQFSKGLSSQQKSGLSEFGSVMEKFTQNKIAENSAPSGLGSYALGGSSATKGSSTKSASSLSSGSLDLKDLNLEQPNLEEIMKKSQEMLNANNLEASDGLLEQELASQNRSIASSNTSESGSTSDSLSSEKEISSSPESLFQRVHRAYQRKSIQIGL